MVSSGDDALSAGADAPHPAEEAITEAEATQIADAVIAGTDTIDVPAALMEEAPEVEKSLLVRLKSMPVSGRIKLALRGSREVRMLLLRDGNRLVRRFVLKNPRVSDDEIIALARNRTAEEEMLREVAENRDWTKNYQVRHALVTNPKTPLVLALRFVVSLVERDIRLLAKSKNVSATVSAQARRIVLTKDSQRGGG